MSKCLDKKIEIMCGECAFLLFFYYLCTRLKGRKEGAEDLRGKDFADFRDRRILKGGREGGF